MAAINKIVVIDDDPIYFFTVSKLLKFIPFEGEVIHFPNGKTGFEGLSQMIASQQTPDMVLLDVNMPIWDGWDFLKELSKTHASIPFKIHVCSSSNNEKDIEAALEFPFVTSYRVKPLNLEVLKTLLEIPETGN